MQEIHYLYLNLKTVPKNMQGIVFIWSLPLFASHM